MVSDLEAKVQHTCDNGGTPRLLEYIPGQYLLRRYHYV